VLNPFKHLKRKSGSALIAGKGGFMDPRPRRREESDFIIEAEYELKTDTLERKLKKILGNPFSRRIPFFFLFFYDCETTKRIGEMNIYGLGSIQREYTNRACENASRQSTLSNIPVQTMAFHYLNLNSH
jgi:hypothetical protein